MMTKVKTNPLAAALHRADEPKAEPQASAIQKAASPAPEQDAPLARKDRANTVLIGGHFPRRLSRHSACSQRKRTRPPKP